MIFSTVNCFFPFPFHHVLRYCTWGLELLNSYLNHLESERFVIIGCIPNFLGWVGGWGGAVGVLALGKQWQWQREWELDGMCFCAQILRGIMKRKGFCNFNHVIRYLQKVNVIWGLMPMLTGMVFNTYSSILLDNGSWQIKTFRRERDHEEKGGL